MIIEGILLAAGATATVYYGPFVIACCSAAVGTIVAGIGGYFAGKHFNTPEDREVQNLREELRNRQQVVLQSSNNLAQETEIHVKKLLIQSQEKQQHLENNLNTLDQNLAKIRQEADKFEETSRTFEETAEFAQTQMDKTTEEMEYLKQELESLNQQLQAAKDALVEKEQTLGETIQQLGCAQQTLKEALKKNQEQLQEVTKQLIEAQELVKKLTDNPIQEIEIQRLRRDNAHLTNSLEKIQSTLQSFTPEFKSLSKNHKQQRQEIKILQQTNAALGEENNKLVKTVEDLADALEAKNNNENLSTPDSTRRPRLFK